MNNPAIRFKRDDGTDYPDLGKKTIGEIAPLRGGFAFKSEEYLNDGIPIVRISNVLSNGLVGGKFAFYKELSNDEAFVLNNGAILIAMSGATTGKVAVLRVKEGEKYYQNQRVGYFSKKDNIYYQFVLSLLQSNRFAIQLLKTSIGGAQPNISAKDINEFLFHVPCLEEQRKIADFLSNIDEIISATEKELEDYELQKKDVMQKIFSQEVKFKAEDGTDYPDWVESNLISRCEFFNGDRGKNYPSSKDLVKEGIPFINAGDLTEGKISIETANKITREKYNSLGGAKIKKNDIIYCLRGSLGKNALADNIEEGTVASSLVVIRATNMNYKYLFYLLNSNMEYKQRLLNDEGCAQPNLSAKNVGEFKFPFPCMEEQQKIADFLSVFDEMIDETKHELECWKQIKKGLLQQMFV